MSPLSDPWGTITNRDQLVDAVSRAAELEHSFCCQYLFAAFSLRGSGERPEEEFREPTRGAARVAELCRQAKRTLLIIARQEMNHLGILCNLLGAIGAPPRFTRPAFPIRRRYDVLSLRLDLLPLTKDALGRFCWAERPLGLELQAPPAFVGGHAHSLGELNQALRAALIEIETSLAANGQTLFTSSVDRQITDQTIFEGDVKLYDVDLHAITDLPSALAAFDQITFEGEGCVTAADVFTRASHFNRLTELKQAWHALEGELGCELHLAKNVGANPFLSDEAGASRPGQTKVSHAGAQAALRLFDLAYETQLLLLHRLFAPWTGAAPEREQLINLAFFPLMTMALRPLGELAVLFPANASQDAPLAGPIFRACLDLRAAPSGDSLWDDLAQRLTRMRDGAAMLVTSNGRYRYLAANFEHLRQGIAMRSRVQR